MNVLKVLLAAIFVAATLSGVTLEDADRLMAQVKNPAFKQSLLCERESSFIFKDPALCIKAAQISLKEYQSIQEKPYDNYDGYRAGMYFNAGIIYSKTGDNANAVEMYKKALEFSPNDATTNRNLAVAYYLGKGIKLNKIKSYEHMLVAAKQGDQKAQEALDIICKESPWACK